MIGEMKMVNVQITYNPYTVKTEILINGKNIEDKVSPLTYVNNKRLQEWIEPKGSWEGIYKTLRNSIGESKIEIDFIGTYGDYADLLYAKERYGNCFSEIELSHVNMDRAEKADPYKKMEELKNLYEKLQEEGPEEFKTKDIQENFKNAINSEFKIVIVAPMSSGKSTLINAIIGQDLLPAVNQATTAVITEVKDNDDFSQFLVNAIDKYGNVVVKNEIASKKVISDLNYMKDQNDPKKKDALIHRIQLEGPIPNLPSNMLNTVFVDTPGGNNSQNLEHEEMMDEAINDENKSIILYVFNGAQLGTNDSNIILQKIANAMRNSTNGKQSRDRFLFVANRMDEFDVSEEPYEDVIEKTILPQLASNGITEPNLFLASAQTAKLIRMVNHGEELSETEEEDMEKLVKRFNRSTRILPKYASLRPGVKEKLIEDAEKYATAAKEEENVKKAEELRKSAAEINSGVTAIEKAIKEYLEKYAIAIKIKNIHDTFMKKVIERNMINSCEAEWAKSQESFEAIKKEVENKIAKCDNSKKKQEFKQKVENIKLETKGITEAKAKIIQEMNWIAEKTQEKVKLEEAEHYLNIYKHRFELKGEKAQVELDNALNNDVIKSCQDIIEEYIEYIKELDMEGFFNIGDFDVKQTINFDAFDMDKAEDILRKGAYIKNEKVQVGSRKVKKKGILNFFARIGGGGYEYVNIYEDQKFVMLKKLIQEQVTGMQHAFDKEVKSMVEDRNEKVEMFKDWTMTKLNGLEQLIKDVQNEINEMLVSQKALQDKVEKNKEKAEWVKSFVHEVEELLNV